LSPKPQL